MEPNECPICQTKELAQTRHELNECKKRGQTKDRQIKKLNKQVFILTAIAVGIGAIFGKEALDSITEWLGSIKSFKSSVQDLSGLIVPAPGTLGLMAIALVVFRPKRRR
tara:strand:+ start:509 stop:835 length:327 start_codon:yes stop_codon:yes gene_type:complete